MNLKERTLLIPEKADIERDEVAAKWTELDGNVLRLGRFWDPPESLISSQVTLYGNDTFCLVLEQKLGLNLISPPDDLIKTIDGDWLQRDVSVISLEEAYSTAFPCFIKPIVPKQFAAAIYENSEDLKKECEGLESDTDVLISSIVEFKAEARSFILNGSVLDVSVYEGNGPTNEAGIFINDFCRSVELPSTCVIDAGYLDELGWVFIEANASWGAGLNGCSADKILPAILEATKMA
jgi:hypothetical protein